ncbi:acyl-CoA dehydrogenase family protein [Paractinoplanes rishiriensis]|uniref:Acyl-CoA dehydrogenase n=1 Tax=Paractinoplanes rishiriensis TaxID=1050105 RepID=A0A919MZX2_9ACTN|nr:acyl-CoA dehydrogenase family protein [Actinoplanes rishiriensis]GIE94357.1 acyl-CoA dehydrogenase [Actinoplanes rishiriensis]
MEQTEERRALADAVRGLLSGYDARQAASLPAGYDPALWTRLCKEIGVAGLAVPEEYGGAGATLLESCVVLAELGRTLMPAPLFSTVLAGQALLLTTDEEARARLLPGLATGDRTAVVILDPVGAAGSRLTGEAHQVLDASAADTFLVATGDALYEVDAAAPGLTARDADALDPTRRLGTVTLDDTPGRRLPGDNPLPALRDTALVALAAEQVGTATRALELTLDYTKTRVQFGRPIGSFQVLQHRLAEAHVRLEAATAAAEAAADALVSGAPDASERAAVAKVTCSETLQAIAAEMTQMHGGLAITWEHDAHLYLRRAWSSAQLFGTPATHIERLAASLLR